MDTCGVILSGGKSRRMGTNKSLLKIGNQTVINRIFFELMKVTNCLSIVTHQPQLYNDLPARFVTDRYQESGPLAGIEAALYYNKADVFIITACDMPFIQYPILQYMIDNLEDYDGVVPVYQTYMHPLAAVYKKSVLEEVQKQLDKGERKVTGFFEEMNIRFIHDFHGFPCDQVERHFFNMNTPEQYEHAKTMRLV